MPHRLKPKWAKDPLARSFDNLEEKEKIAARKAAKRVKKKAPTP
jgi:hypothetical protein